MKYGPVSYHAPGRVFPRSSTRVVFARTVRKNIRLAAINPVVGVPGLVPDTRNPAGVVSSITVAGKVFG